MAKSLAILSRLGWRSEGSPSASSASLSSRGDDSTTPADPYSALSYIGDMDGNKKCTGCKSLWRLLDARKRTTTLPQQALIFHANYAGLDQCAQHCVTCRVFRQALLLESVAVDAAAALARHPGPVSAQLQRLAHGAFVLKIQLDTRAAATVRCLPHHADPPLTLANSPANDAIYRQLRAWLHECEVKHIDCGNLAYSNRKPTRLLRILSDSQVQLVNSSDEASHQDLRYAALSYCWGFAPPKDTPTTGAPGELTRDEERMVDQGRTLRNNVESRYHEPFPIESLPGTVRDAIKITRRLDDHQNGLELRYLWVDTLCIVQDDDQDKKVEIQRMQEVYGNAAVTICATATAKATQPLLASRHAWAQPVVRSCRLGDTWLVVNPTPPATLRLQAPLAHRAWTLQEEHLSPRLLFWNGQQLSWACGFGEFAERDSDSLPSLPAPDNTSATMAVHTARNFLATCRAPEASELCLAWHNMVESYTARSLTNLDDRFHALAGLATRYLAATEGNKYVAGLWRDTFVQDLLWRVSQPARSSGLLTHQSRAAATAPSWSWASLPIGLAVQMSHQFEMRAKIVLLDDETQDEDDGTACLVVENGEDWHSAAVAEGGKVRRIHVRAPLRKLWRPGSQRRAWDQVCVHVDGVEKFKFANPGQDVHAIDRHTTRVLAYEARKQEVVGELDYAQHALLVDRGELDNIYCLAVSDTGMLLLDYHEPTDAFRRVGVTFHYRTNFFNRAEQREIVLE